MHRINIIVNNITLVYIFDTSKNYILKVFDEFNTQL
jgi:hypothetical protein